MTELVTITPATPATPAAFTSAHVALIRSLVMQAVTRAPTDEEFDLFLATCRRTGLDPLARQIYCIERGTGNQRRYVAEVSIDGMRLVAQRSGQYRGQVGPQWAGADGVWYDAWLEDGPPAAARVGVLRAGFDQPLYAVAHYREHCQTKGDGGLTRFWQRMPALMLAKCAEALALRKAFPHELSGIYAADEMPVAPAANEAQWAALAQRRTLLGWSRSQLAAYLRGNGIDPYNMTVIDAGDALQLLQSEVERQARQADPPATTTLTQEELADIESEILGTTGGAPSGGAAAALRS